eukprot:CAMPEP_0169468492 /NCGR_PEP_ID=MMETSP1042-20121227/22938_1 /TAXON_ID=464988 /ORGANISM="Hemiselmis andersenii, Strain CCMP1180" /LENGTH=58 /DNA_ID=CAMNT_0009581831 /DNA_START=104 /DNA_END=276 /DNA_ORIENTATION=+
MHALSNRHAPLRAKLRQSLVLYRGSSLLRSCLSALALSISVMSSASSHTGHPQEAAPP